MEHNTWKELLGHRSLLLFVSITVLICLVWVLLMGFFFNGSIGSFDLLSGHQVILELYQKLPRLESKLYSFKFMGGSHILPLYGLMPIQNILLKLGVSPASINNVTVIFLQSLFPYYLLQLISLGKLQNNIDRLKYIFVICIFAFMPLISWRVVHGHLNILTGVIFFFSSLSIIEMIRKKQFSLFDLILGVFVFANIFSFSSFQMLHSCLVFWFFLLAWLLVYYFSIRKKNN